MASTPEISALSVRLLLLALLSLTPTGAGADEVTWRKCKQWPKPSRYLRVLESSPDVNATTVDISSCHITEIRRGDFDGLPNVDTIGIGFNDDVRIDLAAFQSVQKLTFLSLVDSKLRELPVFDEPSLFPSLTRLDLRDNQFTGVANARTFSACVQLQRLDLSNNHIEYLHPNVFEPLTELTALFLDRNKIAYIPETLFANFNKLTVLNLENNRISHLPSNLVPELSKAGHRLRFLFNDNPWHCACLLELLADLKRAGVTDYNRWWYNGTRPLCVYSGAYPCSRPAPSGLLRAPPRQHATRSSSSTSP